MTKNDFEAEIFELLKPALAKSEEAGFKMDTIVFSPIETSGPSIRTLRECRLVCVTNPDGTKTCHIEC